MISFFERTLYIFCPILAGAYKKNPENPKKWIVNEEASAIVQKVFALC